MLQCISAFYTASSNYIMLTQLPQDKDSVKNVSF